MGNVPKGTGFEHLMSSANNDDFVNPTAQNVVVIKRAYTTDAEQLVVELEQTIAKIDDEIEGLFVGESRLRTWLRLAKSTARAK